MSKSRIALKEALGVPLAAVFALSLAYAFSACSDERVTDDSSRLDSSTDTGSCSNAACDTGDSGQGDASIGEHDAGDAALDGATNDDAALDGAANDGSGDAHETGPVTDGGGSLVRIMTANLTSGNYQSYLDPGIHIFQGIKPDIVMLQEFNYASNSDQDIRSFVDTAFGSSFSYFREADASIPNGIVSRYPMIAKGEWDDTEAPDRDFAWAKLDIPGDTDLWVVSVHLLSGSKSAQRVAQANEILKAIDQNVPASDYVILGGDFNTSTRTEDVVTTLGAKFATSGPYYPQDGAGNDKTNMNRNKPYDWVVGDPRVNALAIDVHIGSQSFPNGLVFDSRVFSPLADVSPVEAGDSNAPNMQHMGVVRDFRFP